MNQNSWISKYFDFSKDTFEIFKQIILSYLLSKVIFLKLNDSTLLSDKSLIVLLVNNYSKRQNLQKSIVYLSI